MAVAGSRLEGSAGFLVRVRLGAGAASVEYLHLFGYVALGYLWARMAKVALAKRGGADAPFYEAKLATARFYMQRILPRTGALFATVMAGSASLMEFPDSAF